MAVRCCAFGPARVVSFFCWLVFSVPAFFLCLESSFIRTEGFFVVGRIIYSRWTIPSTELSSKKYITPAPSTHKPKPQHPPTSTSHNPPKNNTNHQKQCAPPSSPPSSSSSSPPSSPSPPPLPSPSPNPRTSSSPRAPRSTRGASPSCWRSRRRTRGGI